MTETTTHDVIELDQQIKEAQKRLRSRERSLEKAQEKAENARYDLDELIEERDLRLIERWGDNPDISKLLECDKSSAMHRHAEEVFQELGLDMFMANSETNQSGLWIQFESNSASEREFIANSIKTVAPYLKKDSRNVKSLGIKHPNPEECALELSFNNLFTKVIIEKHVHGRVREEESPVFESLDKALVYIQNHIQDVAFEHEVDRPLLESE